jgi:hypothetical protein
VRQYASAWVEKDNTAAESAMRVAILFLSDESNPTEQLDSRISDGIVLPLRFMAE